MCMMYSKAIARETSPKAVSTSKRLEVLLMTTYEKITVIFYFISVVFMALAYFKPKK